MSRRRTLATIDHRSTFEEVLAFCRECARLGLGIGVRPFAEFGRPPPSPPEAFEEQLKAVKRRNAGKASAARAWKGRTRKVAADDRKLTALITRTFRRWADLRATDIRRWVKDNEADPAAMKLGNVSLPRLRRVLAAMKKERRV